MIKLLFTEPKQAMIWMYYSFKINVFIIKSFIFNKEYRDKIIKLFKK